MVPQCTMRFFRSRWSLHPAVWKRELCHWPFLPSQRVSADAPCACLVKSSHRSSSCHEFSALNKLYLAFYVAALKSLLLLPETPLQLLLHLF